MRVRLLLCAVVALLVAALAAPASAVLPATGGLAAGCARGDVDTAAAQLIHPDAEVVDLGTVAGLDSALALEPLVAPGTRHRLVRAGDLWCDATGFNTAWAASGRAAGTVEQAAAFASLAAATYFDGVTVQRATATAPGLVSVDTHARTNGVTATWTVALDRAGVRHASWTATGFGVAPFDAEIEGITALPGLARTYLRDVAGAILPQEQITDAVITNPEVVTAVSFDDGFTIEIHASETPVGPNAGMDSGVTLVDYIRIMADAAEENYNDFLDWGFERSWANAPTPYPHGGNRDIGIIYVNSAISHYCLACVWIRDDFQIHMNVAAQGALDALGYRYPGASDRDVLSDIVGHEMFHNLQNSYGNPGANGASTHVAFAEGTARMQETAHAYSHISHQPQSLVYANNSNGCNGWDGSNRESAFAGGPVNGKTYNACYFWLTWYGTHGPERLIDLLAAMSDHIKAADPTQESFGAIAQATGSLNDDLLQFAAASLSSHGYTWAGHGAEEELDWSTHLDRWSPAQLPIGGQATGSIRNGGMLAREVRQAGVPVLSGDALLGEVRATDDALETRFLDAGDVVDAPEAGEQVWIVAINPGFTAANVTLDYDPAPAQ